MSNYVKRLENLKQATIVNYLDEIDLDQEMDLYDTLLSHLFHGDLDEQFLSDSLEGVNAEEKKRIFQLARRYMSLCFYKGDVNYWGDSIGGVYLSDLDLVAMKLLDNYDYLIRLAKDGGEEVLKQLLEFQKTNMAADSSVIDQLRHAFVNDDILTECLIDISKKDGPYEGLDDVQKEVLCTYPDGVLYTRNGDKAEKISSKNLEKSIREEYFGYDAEEFDGFEKLGRLFRTSPDDFDEVILNIYFRYTNGHDREVEEDPKQM